MNVVLIPFFLAAQFPVQEFEKWTRGAEIIYRFTMTVTITSEKNQEPTVQANWDSVMKCRLKEHTNDTFVCVLRDIRIRTIDEDINENKDYNMIDPFEIKFNERGVEHLVLAYSYNNMEYLSIIRNAAAQLHIGADLKNLLTDSFTAKENSTLGECDTAFEVSWLASKDEAASTDHNPVKLIILNKPQNSSANNVIIKKRRDPKRCSISDDYLSMADHVVSSVSGIAMAKELFESYTVTVSKVKQRKEIIREYVMIRIESILEAEDDKPLTVSNGAITGLNLNEETEHNFLDPHAT